MNQPPPKKVPAKVFRPPALEVPNTLPEAYYDDNSKNFWVRAPSGDYVHHTEGSLKKMLLKAGLSTQPARELLSEADEWILKTKQERYVKYAGSVAGHWSGYEKILGRPVLVVDSPTMIEGVEGDNWLFYTYVERLLGPQSTWYHGWLKLARIALKCRNYRAAQVFFLLGDSDHGKSLLLKMTNLCISGRMINPKQSMDGYTFNEDVFGHEFLAMDDVTSDDSHKSRALFGAALKQMIADSAPRCHGKGKRAITLQVFWRLMVCGNIGVEDLQIVPTGSNGLDDKVIMCKTVGRAIDQDTSEGEDYDAYYKSLVDSLPSYLYWLDHEFKIPIENVHPRFGMRSFRDEEICKIVRENNPEIKLLHLIDTELDFSGGKEYVYTANQLETEMKSQLAINSNQSRELLKGPSSMGRYLARLAKEHPERVMQTTRVPGGGSMRYKILGPEANILVKSVTKEAKKRA